MLLQVNKFDKHRYQGKYFDVSIFKLSINYVLWNLKVYLLNSSSQL
jgi:hypothetical protein